MAVNSLTFEQSANFLNALYRQATGLDNQEPVTYGNFVTVAQATLKTGYDNVINAISQVIGRTIFSVRPYTAKFKGIDVSEQKWGAITRKINFIDGGLETDDRLNLVDGQSVDPWKVNKPKILQTNFYGATQYQKSITIFKDQLDAAFHDADEFGRFIAGVLQNVEDQLEQIREAEARACLSNYILGMGEGGGTVINVLQEYMTQTGTTGITTQTMFNDQNFVPFTKWLYSYVNTLTREMGERSIKFHSNIDGKPIMRHTPADRMKAYMTASFLDKIGSVALPSLFGADRLKMIDFEPVTYWQSYDVPTSVSGSCTFMNSEGNLTTKEGSTCVGILGLIFDEDALGITRMSTWSQATPMNPRGGYYNIFWHFTQRMWNDFTENAVLLVAQDE